MAIRLIVIDLDETLLRKDKTYEVERFKAVVEKLRSRGILFTIATGNSFHKIQDYIAHEDQRDIYFACDNGNFIVKNGELLKVNDVSRETVKKIDDFLSEFDGYHMVINTGDKAYFKHTEGLAYDHIIKYNNVLLHAADVSAIPEGEAAKKLAIYSEHSLEQNKTLVRIIHERFEDVRAVTSGDGWLDIYSAAGGKGSAVRYLQDKYAIRKEETMTFGDSMNDESMMLEAAYALAMGNADHDLLLAATHQIGTNEDQAVVSVLEALSADDNLDFLDKYQLHG